MNSMLTQLLLGLIGAMTAALLGAGVWTYAQVRHEIIEITDFQLRQIAEALPPHIPTQTVAEAGGPEELIVVQLFDAAGELVYASHPDLVLPRQPGEGLLTVAGHGQQWRVYRMQQPDRQVLVAQTLASRDAMVIEVAVRTLLPFALLVPLLVALVWFVVWRSLRSLRMLTAALAARSAHSLEPLDVAMLAADLRPMAQALNELLEQLRAALGAQQAFIGNAAHELRSPLMALKLQLQLLERSSSPPKREAALARLHQGLDRATHLVRQLLNLARFERPMHADDLEVIDLRELAQHVVAELAAAAEDRRVDLGVLDEARTVHARTERESLRILLVNLVDNAVRYSAPQQRVDVIVSIDDHGCPLLQVLDNGPGIDPAERDRVFDRFYRGAEATHAAGSGLGLAIVRSISERIGAVVTLADNPLGSGLLASVRLHSSALTAPGARSALQPGAQRRETLDPARFAGR